MELGNNLNADKFYRARIPLFDEFGNTVNGVKYFFPELPAIENKNIVGIEAHLATTVAPPPPPSNDGDLAGSGGQPGKNLLSWLAAYVYITIFDHNGAEIFYNVPLYSLFNRQTPAQLTKRVKPYYGKIKTRRSYLIIPANATVSIAGDYVVNLTFFYNN
jgi:hypothetical protein